MIEVFLDSGFKMGRNSVIKLNYRVPIFTRLYHGLSPEYSKNMFISFQNPMLVKRGSTIATLLAAIFRDECQKLGVRLDEHGILQG